MSENPAIPDRELFESRMPDAYPLSADYSERVHKWFSGAGLGLFICWDHASQQGLEMSWPLVGGVSTLPGKAVSVEQYHSTEDSFNPVNWDPVELAKLAKAARMTYAVFTAKHHSGWAMWPSKHGDRNIGSSEFGKTGGDVLRSYIEAFRAERIKIGVYYSLSDWGHEDYLAWKDEYLPYEFGHDSPMGSPEQWARYREYLKGQLEEILTEYGQVDLLWFDGSWERSEEQWGTQDIADNIRKLSPETIINDRLPTQGDYRTPEQWIPAQVQTVPWECCMTMNYSWGYVPDDYDFKSPYEILRTLIEVVSRGGNLLLSIGPKGDGALAPQEHELMQQLGEWMQVNGDSVIDAEPGLEPWQFYGPSTKRGKLVYLHLFGTPGESVVVRGIKIKQVRSVVNLATGESYEFKRRAAINDTDLLDPEGEIIIDTSDDSLSGLIPVLVVDMGGDATQIKLTNY
jgi:alpha-L-fucosidase